MRGVLVGAVMLLGCGGTVTPPAAIVHEDPELVAVPEETVEEAFAPPRKWFVAVGDDAATQPHLRYAMPLVHDAVVRSLADDDRLVTAWPVGAPTHEEPIAKMEKHCLDFATEHMMAKQVIPAIRMH